MLFFFFIVFKRVSAISIRKIKEKGITNAEFRETCIDIYEGENEIFKIDRNGGMFLIILCKNIVNLNKAEE